MKKTWLIICAVVLIAAIAWAGVLFGQKNDLQKKLDEMTTQAETLEAELAAVRE